MLLVELFDSSVDYKVVERSTDKYVVEGKVGKRWIEITFDRFQEFRGTPEYWAIAFEEFQEERANRDPREIGDLSTTGSGGAPRVFALVKRAVTDFFKQYKPSAVSFQGKSGGRSAVYKKMLERFLTSEYHFTSEEVGRSEYFWVKRKAT